MIAVLDMQCGKGVDKALATPLTNVIIEELVKIGTYKVIDRANRDKILGEQGFQQHGCVSDKCVVEMGQMLGVGKIVVGTIDLIGQTYIINLQLINVQTGL
jgi:TolB-like protein